MVTDSASAATTVSAFAVDSELYGLGRQFLRAFLILIVCYTIGWLGFSFSWILIALVIWILRAKYAKDKEKRVELQHKIASDEKAVINCVMRDLPAWVYFPDIERAEWINKVLKQMWPYIDEYVKLLIKQSIEPNITSSLPEYLKSFRFEKIELGNIPVRIGSVKCYDENTSREEIILDLEIIYAGNCDIQVRIKGMKAGIKDLQLYGILRVLLRPLIKELPLVGCVSFYFLNNPSLEFNLTNLADILDMPGLSDLIRKAIMEQLAALMVVPNKMVFPLVDHLSTKSIKFSQPIGAVRIELIEAKNLKKADIGMLGLGKSDPYARLIVGSQEFRSPVIKNTVNPKWRYACEALIHHVHGQHVEIEVMDEDQGSRDDFLGRTSLSLATISGDGMVDAWLTLRETKTGSIHVRCTWLSLTDTTVNLSDRVNDGKLFRDKYHTQATADNGSTIGSVAALVVFLDCAKNLPIITKSAGEPSPYVVFSVGAQTRHSNVKNGTLNPVWEESFSFLLDNLNPDLELCAQILDSRSNRVLGASKLMIKDVLACDGLAHNYPLVIYGKSSDCTLNVNVLLRVLCQPKSARITSLVEETTDETDGNAIPSLEDMIKGTIQPILDTSGLKQDVIDASLNDRENTHNNQNKANSHEKLDYYPRIQFTVRRMQNKLVVILHSAENLPKNGDKKPDPYVKLYRLPDRRTSTLRGKVQQKSETKRSTTNPVYEQTFEYEYDKITEGPNAVEAIVYDGSASSKFFQRRNRKILGIASIKFTDLKPAEEMTNWYDLEQLAD